MNVVVRAAAGQSHSPRAISRRTLCPKWPVVVSFDPPMDYGTTWPPWEAGLCLAWPELFEGSEYLVRPGALAVGVRLERPAYDPALVHEERRGEGDVGAVRARGLVSDTEHVEKHTLLIAEEGEVAP